MQIRSVSFTIIIHNNGLAASIAILGRPVVPAPRSTLNNYYFLSFLSNLSTKDIKGEAVSVHSSLLAFIYGHCQLVRII
jgi:hypothetical protein